MLVANFGGVRRVQTGAAGIEISELPIFQMAVRIHGGANVYDAGRAEISPSKFFLASPDDFDGLFGGAGETRRFDCCFTGVFAAVTGAGVWHQDVHAFLRNVKRGGEFFAHAKGPLRAGPNS